MNNHVRENLGNKRLCDIQDYEVQKIYNNLKDKDFSPKTIRHIHNVLSSALKQAVRWKMLIQDYSSKLPLIDQNHIDHQD